MKISPAVKVGILTLLSIVILVFGLMWLKGRSISSGERIEINFSDVDGMRPGSAVQMMGIRIGQVEDVIPVIKGEKSFVKVRFVIIEPGISIPLASTISIQQSGIIGEKFLEITPPQIHTVYLPVIHGASTMLGEGSPVELLANNKYLTIGEVKNFEVVDAKTLTQTEQDELNSRFAYKVGYVINTPGITVPDHTKGFIKAFGNTSQKNKLRLLPPENMIVQAPEPGIKYTIVEPMRLKEFFDLQLKSAAALQETNDKINSILTEESINDLKVTLKNTKNLTAKANVTLDQAIQVLSSSKSELQNVVDLASNLSNKMIVLADNVNNIVEDPELKKNLLTTVKSIEKSSRNLSDLLADPQLKDTLTQLNSTSKDLSEISKYMNGVSKDQEFRTKLDSTLSNMNTSLSKFSQTLDTVNGLTTEEKQKLKDMINDSSETTKNMKKFSDKLNKRFLLFRLMF